MAEIKIITLGSLKEGYLKEAVEEYRKRLSQYAKIEHIEIKEERICDEDNPKEIASALDREAEKILSKSPKNAYTVALCIEGKECSSVELAGIIADAVDRCGKITFIIGSSHGLAKRVKNTAQLCLSFSKLTFPHQLMRVILYEAVYRSFTILSGKKYHK